MKATMTAVAVVTAVASAGPPALAGLEILAALLLGALCWIIANRSRTENTVTLITARAMVGPARHPRRMGNPGDHTKSGINQQEARSD
jgi:hypothetical protein